MNRLMRMAAFGVVTGLTLTAGIWAAPATRPAKVENGWDAKFFSYDRPTKMIVEETTPTAAQVSWIGRPPQIKEDEPEPKATGSAKPRTLQNINIVHLRFKDTDGQIVPALLCTPDGAKGPFPLVVAVHGLTSNKMQVCGQVAPTLTKRGFAVLAADMPCHGERPGEPRTIFEPGSPKMKRAIMDVRQCIDLAEARPELDVKGGVALVGYSMGSWIDSAAGAADQRVKAMVLMVGGAADIPAIALRAPQIAATDPRLAIAHFAGRPLLMLNGTNDQTVKSDMSKRLFAAAQEPKKQVWYESGHLLPADAYEDAAKWIAETMGKKEKPKPATRPE